MELVSRCIKAKENLEEIWGLPESSLEFLLGVIYARYPEQRETITALYESIDA